MGECKSFKVAFSHTILRGMGLVMADAGRLAVRCEGGGNGVKPIRRLPRKYSTGFNKGAELAVELRKERRKCV